VIPLLFLSWAENSFCILVSAILCFFVSTSLDTSNKKDSTLIMQLLRDNLTLWTSDMQVCIHCYIDVCFMDSAGLLVVDFLVLKQ
jgi:hypothetical protein